MVKQATKSGICYRLYSNRQLAKLLSGFVTGQITVAKVVVTVAAQYTCMGKMTS